MPWPSTSPPDLPHLRRAVQLLDDGFRVPGTRIRIGLDPLLGLVPGIGDVAGGALAVAIIGAAVRQGVSRYTLLRMAGNIALDAAVGIVPILGDLFDVVWKANRRNLTLLERHAAEPVATTRADRRFVALVLGGLVLLLVALLVAGVMLGLAVVRWLVVR